MILKSGVSIMRMYSSAKNHQLSSHIPWEYFNILTYFRRKKKYWVAYSWVPIWIYIIFDLWGLNFFPLFSPSFYTKPNLPSHQRTLFDYNRILKYKLHLLYARDEKKKLIGYQLSRLLNEFTINNYMINRLIYA